MSNRKRITILGCTGSIGQSTLDIIRQHPDKFELFACTAHKNLQAMRSICEEFSPSYAALADASAQAELAAHITGGATNAAEVDAIAAMEVDIVVAAMVGASGVSPILQAIAAGNDIALANKEALVCAGPQVMAAAKKHAVRLLPVDSEHNAVFQLWQESHRAELTKVTLTASGGPFRERPLNSFASITPEEAVAHPNWDMGAKISVDSATMMNKALELIEAHYLFDLPAEQLDAVIHPQSTIHAFVSYADGSTLAQLAQPDMRIPIAGALAWPDRVPVNAPHLALQELGRLEFIPIDADRYPLFMLGLAALKAGQAAMIALNAANEVAVDAFLSKRIGYMEIGSLVASVLEKVAPSNLSEIEEVLAWDAQSREHARQWIKG